MMVMMIALGGLALWSAIATVELVSRDGYSRVPTLEWWAVGG
ncbi:hypothetical protein HDC94_000615 [Leifsonia sp. AK011]|nr:hypothetical protein [Leifsonia sp. AK011]NYF09459.1 hypothetical protein [Leifsonia sp. AK011]